MRKATAGAVLVLLLGAVAQPPEGKAVPPISLPTLDGKQLDLKAVYDRKRKETALSLTLRYRSGKRWVRRRVPAKAVLLDFWASWCGPCMMAIPRLIALHRKYSGKGLVVVGVNLGEGRPVVSKVVKELGIPYIVALDQGYSTAKPYRIEGIPTLVLVDSKGIVRGAQVGFSPQVEERIEGAVKLLLGIR